VTILGRLKITHAKLIKDEDEKMRNKTCVFYGSEIIVVFLFKLFSSLENSTIHSQSQTPTVLK